ncbi:MAG: ATP-dependent Clp protease ATP-binding subunit [Ruminococcaceae bacterium]|nr:ATP-dependent Clp protease ATP-binding subunit [Oscillospiraceae bacterium]
MQMLCTRCKKNMAVVFVTKMEQDGKQVNEGYCLSCAKELNINAIDSMIEKLGIDPEEFDSMNSETMEMMRGMMDGGEMPDMSAMMGMLPEELMDGEDFDDSEDGGATKKSPLSFLSNMFGGINESSKDGQTEEKGTKPPKKEKTKNKRKFLDMYGTNLTAKARNGEIDRVVGRELEMNRVTQILNRRTKNNPVLIGEPGVGKTAIAEGLALRIAEGNVPAKLLGYEIYLLDMAAMVAGTQFRGQFESRLKSLITEVKALGNIILVIDEVHVLTKAGDAEGAMNAGNILKPALSRGEIQIIGATTLEEYRKHIEKDSALERRFQTVIVEEPSVEETIEMLKGIKSYYEDYHKVKITDEIIRTAAVLSKRYITDRFLPDKAIDVIDEAASKANLDNTALTEAARLKTQLEDVKNAQLEIETAPEGENADPTANYEKIAELKSRECQLVAAIEEIEKTASEVYLTPDDLSAVIEGWTKIPVKNITEFETNRLVNLEERLHKNLIGQDDAVSAVSRGIRRKRAGFSLKRRPASFIFVGPTGVGKTELVKQIAREVFDTEDALIRFDMSEFMEKHSASRLVGSPPGYVGYDDAGQLTEKVRRHPYSVILFDEIEKAHPDVFNMLLQILDDGRITDSHGKTVSFEDCIIVMTSNAGSDTFGGVAGFGATNNASNKVKAEKALKQLFRPEFLNRVDEIIVFEELTTENLLKIVDLMLGELSTGLTEKGITMNVTDGAKALICKDGYDSQYGARPMRRYIERHIEDKLARMFIGNEIQAGCTVTIDEKDGKITVE